MSAGLLISVQEAQKAVSDKSRLDAFCFALKIKVCFRSSGLLYQSLNSASEKMRMDKRRFKYLLEAALLYGYVHKEVSPKGAVWFIARKLHAGAGEKDLVYRVRKDDLENLTFPQLRFLVRRIVVENFIDTIEETVDTHVKATRGESVKEIRRSRQRERRMLRGDFDWKRIGCSYETMAALTNGSLYMARKIVRNLVARKIVEIEHRWAVCKGVKPDALRRSLSFRDVNGELIIVSGGARTAFSVLSNHYKVIDKGVERRK